MKRSYEDLKARSRQRVVEKLERVIAAYDGGLRSAREIFRGLEAASDLDLDLRPFFRELGKRSRQRRGADHKRGKLAS